MPDRQPVVLIVEGLDMRHIPVILEKQVLIQHFHEVFNLFRGDHFARNTHELGLDVPQAIRAIHERDNKGDMP